MVNVYLIILILIQSTIAISFIAASFFGKKAVIDSDNKLSGTWIIPVSELNAKLQLLPISAVGGNKKAFSGILTLNGYTQPVSGIVDLSGTNATVKFKIQSAEFGIEIPEETLNLGIVLEI
jgi:hypothetical protein